CFPAMTAPQAHAESQPSQHTPFFSLCGPHPEEREARLEGCYSADRLPTLIPAVPAGALMVPSRRPLRHVALLVLAAVLSHAPARAAPVEIVSMGESAGPHVFAFSRDGTRIVTGEARIWDLESGRIVHASQIEGTAMAFSPDRTRVLSGEKDAVKLFD